MTQCQSVNREGCGIIGAVMNENQKMEQIVSLAKRRGFIYQGSEIYGGLSGTWDYGPLGVTLKRNIMNMWWKMFVEERDDMYGVDAAILMNQRVWKASGHVDTFTDPLVECKVCHSRYRTDKLIDDVEYKVLLNVMKSVAESQQAEFAEKIENLSDLVEYSNQNPSPSLKSYLENEAKSLMPDAKLLDFKRSDLPLGEHYLGNFPRTYLTFNNIKCENCGALEWSLSSAFNMMFNTIAGPKWGLSEILDEGGYIQAQVSSFDKQDQQTQTFEISKNDKIDSLMYFDKAAKVYLRPETAQGMFTNYKNILDSFYPDLPFGIAQQGKAFRNEISPRDFIFRSREFEQMEIEYFVDPTKWEESFEHWRQQVWRWTEALGLPAESVHELEVEESDRAHYSKRTIDFEFDFPIGREELLGLAYRTDFDLGNIVRESGKNMDYTIKGTNNKFVPHVIEPSFGVERAVMAVLSSSYREDEVGGDKRIYLKLPEHLAPVRFAVSPLVRNKPELVEKAREVYGLLKKKYNAVMWDDNGNIGKRYRRQDEIGTPHCVVVDFTTLEDGTVTVRDRDTTEQTRVKIEDL